MNPFIESTVARPAANSGAVPPWTHYPHVSPRNRARTVKRNRSVISLTLGLAGLATGLGLVWPAAAQAVDVNAATATQLESVRGIGPKMAQVIIQERLRGGPYESFDDLAERVRGIGPKKAVSLRESGLTLDGAAAAASSLPAPGATTNEDKASTPAPAARSPKPASASLLSRAFKQLGRQE